MEKRQVTSDRRPVRPRVRRRALSPLTQKILAVNFFGLLLLVAGVLYVNQFRLGLIEIQIEALTKQGNIIAAAVTEAGNFGPSDVTLEPGQGQDILRRLVIPTGTRARLFAADGGLVEDTLLLSPAAVVIDRLELDEDSFYWKRWVDDTYDWVVAQFGHRLPAYQEYVADNASAYTEVQAALNGARANAVRVNSQGEVVVSIAVPVQRFKVVMGALMLSTRGGEIEEIVRSERFAILRVFVIALGVTGLLSLLLAAGIARPVHRLARAAEQIRFGHVGAGTGERREVPDMRRRRDEIGDLSVAMNSMLDALYDRIEAIESFAADVAHEIKNPLTSLKSAVETFSKARDDDARSRLIDIIQHDVRRLDRLISDISNASRLDAELVREEMEEVDLNRLLETVVALYRDRESLEAVKIVLGAPDVPVTISGLETSLGQVLRNLIDNALTFCGPDGRISVSGRITDGVAKITVDDTGPGIPPDNLSSIFERFYTERPEAEGFGRHSGLGLSISRQIVEAHGGNIHAENIQDLDGTITGARFVVELPV